MKIKTSELTGRALDWAVASAIGAIGPTHIYEGDPRIGFLVGGTANLKTGVVAGTHDPAYTIFENGDGDWRPSTNWAQGGPLIERFHALPQDSPPHRIHLGRYMAQTSGAFNYNGDTPLIAACRAIVSESLGAEVDVPDALGQMPCKECGAIAWVSDEPGDHIYCSKCGYEPAGERKS